MPTPHITPRCRHRLLLMLHGCASEGHDESSMMERRAHLMLAVLLRIRHVHLRFVLVVNHVAADLMSIQVLCTACNVTRFRIVITRKSKYYNVSSLRTTYCI